MKTIGVVGTGYVGLVQGVIMAEFGMNVICMDVLEEKIEKLKNGIVPIYEPGLKDLMDKNISAGRLHFTTDMKETVEQSGVIFIAVGTPPMEDGSADLRYVVQVAEQIGKHMNGYKVVVDKSTVPVGTGAIVKQTIQNELNKRGVNHDVDVVSNPEFLREGHAVQDCLTPDRVVIGTDNERALNVMKEVYGALSAKQTPFLFTSINTAELIKYASNSFLAVKISFINEMALLADKVGANILEVAQGMGMDSRISPKFLNAGPGFGGSCFPKDTKAIVDIGSKNNEPMSVVEAAIAANEKQKQKMAGRITDRLRDIKPLNDCTVAIWGLSFKPETDDTRDAPSLDIIRSLVAKGINVKAYCPQGMKEAGTRLADINAGLVYCKDEYEAVENADALVLMTEWDKFANADMNRVKSSMTGNVLFDLRNMFYKNDSVKESFEYHGVGTGQRGF